MKKPNEELEAPTIESSFEDYHELSLWEKQQSEISQPENEESADKTISSETVSTLQSIEVTRIPRLSCLGTYAKLGVSRDCSIDKKSIKNTKLSNRHVNFCKRKSLSLMEIQRLRSVPRSPKKAVQRANESMSNVVSPSSRGDASCYDRASLQRRNDFYCFMSDSEEAELDPKLAGMRVFASIMLNAWRRRRDEVRRLNEELNRMKKSSVKAKSQIHVISSLFKVEQKTNDDLSNRLRRVLEDQKKLQDLYNDLNKAYTLLQAKYSETDRIIEEKTKELEGLNFLLGESKGNLFKTMARERELETSLSNEQRKLTEFENEKNELLSTIARLDQTIASKVAVEKCLEEKKSEIVTLKSQLDLLEKKLKELKEKEALVKEYQQIDVSQRKVIQELTDKVTMLEESSRNTIIEQAKVFLKDFRKSTVQYSHMALYLLLPMAPPPPKVDFKAPPIIEKALKYCWI